MLFVLKYISPYLGSSLRKVSLPFLINAWTPPPPLPCR